MCAFKAEAYTAMSKKIVEGMSAVKVSKRGLWRWLYEIPGCDIRIDYQAGTGATRS
jgi:hypothetical protein